MSNKRPLRLPSARLIMIAAIAGILAGAVAVYVKEAGSGNGAELSDAQCADSGKRVASVAALAKGEIAALTAPQKPRLLQPVSFQAADGRTIGLQEFKGKTVLVNLWATWCIPCREEMPALNRLQAEKGNRNFEVVAINIDTGSDEKPKNFLAETGVDRLGFYRDSSMGVFNAFKKEGLAFGLPVTLILDKQGCLIGSMNGPAAWDSPQAQDFMAQISSL
ncbi:thiol:disulfide interchange protein TlpA [Rhizobium oryzicola]|uniref:TlpA disulfide reductase family protein n=1 Tax=Rhizobium oryzicola TaxID=1232668 RepID=A0ABT8T0D8_9HYPH|nr:TlpA disulfide reductase family protein [Rhizobium oryzicola]MDO1584113.1 TlpA disulfide reductase family protein [Rhizobium oryzicola]